MNSGAVLFDFDGTLADTAPDLAAAVNRMLVEQVKVRSGALQDGSVTPFLEPANDGTPHHAGVAGDVDLRVSIPLGFRLFRGGAL